jgi:hypothetical protein
MSSTKEINQPVDTSTRKNETAEEKKQRQKEYQKKYNESRRQINSERYRNDPDFKERVKATSRKKYYATKEALEALKKMQNLSVLQNIKV